MSTYRYEKGCCIRTFVPLDVAYARTIHKFQGLSAGPVDEGKVPNMYEYIICDPDAREEVWRKCTWTTVYSCVSGYNTRRWRRHIGSAIYFTASKFKERRIRRLTKLKDSNEDFKVAQKRKKWVQYLTKREKDCKTKQKRILRKAKKSTISSKTQSMIMTSFTVEYRNTKLSHTITL